MVLYSDDDDKLRGFSGDDDNGDDSVVVVVDSDVYSLMNNMKYGVIAVTLSPVSWCSFDLVWCRSSTPQFYQQVDR